MQTRELDLIKINSSARRSVFTQKLMKLIQNELFSIFKSEYVLRVYRWIYSISLRTQETDTEMQFLKSLALSEHFKIPLC